MKPVPPRAWPRRACRQRFARVPPLASLVLCSVLAACGDDDPTEPDGRVVAGVDLDVLFAPATQAEIDAVLADWAGRSPVADGVQTEASVSDTLAGTPVEIRIVSHLVDGNRHYSAIVIPDGASPATLPVLMYLHGGDGGFSIADLELIADRAPSIVDDFVWAAPAFRSEPLRFGAQTFTSEGTPSPWDRDVDDALALLDLVADETPAADPARVGLLGLSRGAGVALLMAEREPSIDLVVEFFGPTDFFGEFVQEVVEEALLGTLRDLPGLEFLNGEYIVPLREGETGIPAVRTQLVRRSAVLFADRLPDLQVHHGALDPTVEVTQAASLIATMQALGRGSAALCPPEAESGVGASPLFEACIYETGSHSPLTMPGSIPRSQAFLERLVQP